MNHYSTAFWGRTRTSEKTDSLLILFRLTPAIDRFFSECLERQSLWEMRLSYRDISQNIYPTYCRTMYQQYVPFITCCTLLPVCAKLHGMCSLASCMLKMFVFLYVSVCVPAEHFSRRPWLSLISCDVPLSLQGCNYSSLRFGHWMCMCVCFALYFCMFVFVSHLSIAHVIFKCDGGSCDSEGRAPFH